MRFKEIKGMNHDKIKILITLYKNHCLNIKESMESNSYYKISNLPRKLGAVNKLNNTISRRKRISLRAVSYTHLDVYKRQVLYRTLIKPV